MGVAPNHIKNVGGIDKMLRIYSKLFNRMVTLLIYLAFPTQTFDQEILTPRLDTAEINKTIQDLRQRLQVTKNTSKAINLMFVIISSIIR